MQISILLFISQHYLMYIKEKKSEEKAKCNEFEFKKNSALSLLT